MDGKDVEELYDPTVDDVLAKSRQAVGQFGAARIIIEGHTDSSMKGQVAAATCRPSPPRSRSSRRNRAKAVKQALVEKFKAGPQPRSRCEGMGWDKPADPDDPNNQTKNRRVEVKVYPAESRRQVATRRAGGVSTPVSCNRGADAPGSPSRSSHARQSPHSPRRSRAAGGRHRPHHRGPAPQRPGPAPRNPPLADGRLRLLCLAVCFGLWWFVTRGGPDGERIISRVRPAQPGRDVRELPQPVVRPRLTRNTLVTLKRVVSASAWPPWSGCRWASCAAASAASTPSSCRSRSSAATSHGRPDPADLRPVRHRRATEDDVHLYRMRGLHRLGHGPGRGRGRQPVRRHGLHPGGQPLAGHPQGAGAAGDAEHLQLAAAAVRAGLRLHHAGRDDQIGARAAAWATSSTCRSAAARASTSCWSC